MIRSAGENSDRVVMVPASALIFRSNKEDVSGIVTLNSLLKGGDYVSVLYDLEVGFTTGVLGVLKYGDAGKILKFLHGLFEPRRNRTPGTRQRHSTNS